jgi:hypothetical protein
MPTSVRTTVGGVICMGVKDVGEGARVLSEETIEAGADPGWKNRKPGALYAELPGTDPDDWSLPGRTFKPDRDAVIAELVTCLASTGQTVTAPAVRPAPPVVPMPPAAMPPRADSDDEADDPEADKDAECAPLPVDPDCPPDADPYQPITVPRRERIPLDLGPENGKQYTPVEIRRMIRTSILSGYDKGIRQVRPHQFAAIVDEVGEEGLKPPTLTKILGEFCQGPQPLLRRAEDRGVYEILPPEGSPDPALVPAAA